MCKVAFLPFCKHVHTEKFSKRTETHNQEKISTSTFHQLFSLWETHHLPKKKRAKTKTQATNCCYLQLRPIPELMTTFSYCKQYYDLRPTKTTRSMHHEAESCFVEVKGFRVEWVAGGVTGLVSPLSLQDIPRSQSSWTRGVSRPWTSTRRTTRGACRTDQTGH